MNWPRTKITIGGADLDAAAPLILSASRRTDIPAFLPDWFFDCLGRGWFETRNPFNPSRRSMVSAENVRFVVFWTRHAAPIMDRLHELDGRKIGYYFLYTLNDYEKEGWEPSLPPLSERVATFRRLSDRVGPDRVLWRFDPLALSDRLGPEELLARVARLGRALKGATEKLIFSFLDRECYPAVRRSFAEGREFQAGEMEQAGRELALVGKENGFEVASCAEAANLSKYGIAHNSCVDERLIRSLSAGDPVLTAFLDGHRGRLKDTSQRKACGCIVSRDIGVYGTCGFNCRYCYARARALPTGPGTL